MLHILEAQKADTPVDNERVLFRGNSCFPLSPFSASSEGPEKDKDQMSSILEVLGGLRKRDTDFITDSTTRSYLKMMQKSNQNMK